MVRGDYVRYKLYPESGAITHILHPEFEKVFEKEIPVALLANYTILSLAGFYTLNFAPFVLYPFIYNLLFISTSYT